MATFKTSANEITIQDPRFPYDRGSRPLIIHHNTRDGEWKSGSITGPETGRPVLAPRFLLTSSDYLLLYNFITTDIGDGLLPFAYWDSETPGTDGSYLMTYLGGLESARSIDRNRYDVSLSMEGRLRDHRTI